MKNIYSSVEEYEKNCYLFAPSVSKRKTVGGSHTMSAGTSKAEKTLSGRWNGLL